MFDRCKEDQLFCSKIIFFNINFTLKTSFHFSFIQFIKKELMDGKPSGKLNQKSKQLIRGTEQDNPQKDYTLMDQNSGFQVRNHSSTLEQIYQSSDLIEDCQQNSQLEEQQRRRMENQKLSQQNRIKKNGSKDIPPRILIKFLDYLQKKRKITQKDYDSLRARGGNLRLLEQFFQNMSYRPLIAEYFLTRQFKKDVLTSKKRLNLKDQSPTNSLKNLLKLETFITFCFLQGSIKNFASLQKPIHDESSLYQNRTKFQQLDQVPIPQLMDFYLESPQLDNKFYFHDSEDEQWNCLEQSNENENQTHNIRNYKR